MSAREEVPTLGPQDQTTEQFELVAEYSELGTAIIEAVETEEFTVTVSGLVESEGAEASFESSHQT